VLESRPLVSLIAGGRDQMAFPHLMAGVVSNTNVTSLGGQISQTFGPVMPTSDPGVIQLPPVQFLITRLALGVCSPGLEDRFSEVHICTS
jgi:hypothetical protein